MCNSGDLLVIFDRSRFRKDLIRILKLSERDELVLFTISDSEAASLHLARRLLIVFSASPLL
jgi:hypothetical protein